MRKNDPRKAALLYFLSAMCFLAVGIIGIIQDDTMPYVFIGLSCAFVCLGCVNLTKAKKASDAQAKDQETK